MATANYEKFKTAWQQMDEQTRNQQTELYKNDSNFQQFAQQYHDEMYWSWSSNSNSNTNNQNGTNWSYDPIYYSSQNQNNNNQNNNNNQGWSTLSDWKNGNWNFYGNTSFDKEEQFDKSMIGDDPWKITIEAGTGKTTGRPDYEDSSDQRINELTDNLNRYYQTNPEYFADRETFNRQFEYNQRMSDRQRATLDSYWKKAQDIKTASQYTTWDRISAWIDNAEITPDVFNLIKQNNPEAYAQYQKEMQDWINKAMANLSFTWAEPLDVTIERIINKLGIWVDDPHDIKKVYYDSLDKLNVWQDSEQLHVLWNNISSMMSTMNSNAQSLSSQLEGRYSAGYIEARINKANSNIQRQLNTALNSYQMLLQWRQQNIALATQNAQIEQAQAQEEQRIFDDKLKALWFAMEYNSYRTPEQKTALELQKEQISNNMDLLKQSQMNDLALYNKYANAKLDNQLEAELTDLSVTDPTQLRANLSNVLQWYYDTYWDIIQRSKSQVVDDVLAYAQENWVSVAEALKKNFIEPLQSKPEYKSMIRNNYWMNAQIQKVWDTLVWITYDDNWIPQYHTIWWSSSAWTSSFTNYTPISSSSLSSWIDNFINSHPEWSDWWQCWEFVNDYLQSLWLDRLFTDPIDKKKAVKNSDEATVWSIAIMDSKNYPQYWHVAIVTSDNGDWTVNLLESNWGWDEAVHVRNNVPKSSIYWYFDPSKWSAWLSSRFAWDSDWNVNWYFSSLEPDYKSYFESWKPALTDSKWKSLLNTYWITEKEFREQAQAYAKTWLKQSWANEAANALESALKLYEYVSWDREWFFWDSLQWWLLDKAMAYIPWTDQRDARNEYDTLMSRMSLKSLFEAKANWATFWSMSDSEWKILWDASTNLKWSSSAAAFKENLENLISALESAVKDWNWTLPSNYSASSYSQNSQWTIKITAPSYATQWTVLNNLPWWFTNYADMLANW